MALAICDHPLPPTSAPQRSVRHRRGRPPAGRCVRVHRRRCLAGLVVVALGAGGFTVATEAVAAVGRGAIDPPAGAAPEGGHWVTRPAVPGESLWSIAASLAGDSDIRPYVDELARINGGTMVRSGDPVRIPASWLEAGR